MWAPADAIEAAFSVSESLAEKPELLDAIIHTPWFSGDIYQNPINGDFLTWVMRDALSEAGMWGDYAKTDAFFKEVNDELDAAFASGELEEDDKFRLVPSTGGRTGEEILGLGDDIKKIYRCAVLLDEYVPGAAIMNLNGADTSYESYVCNTNFSYTIGGRVTEVSAVNRVISVIFSVYRIMQAILLLGTAAAVLAELFVTVFRRKRLNILNINIILAIIALVAISAVYAFCIAWFCTFVELHLKFYSSAICPMIYLVELFGLALLANVLRQLRDRAE